MARALRRHDEILRAAIGQAGGFVFKTVGDAFCAAFEHARRPRWAPCWPPSRRSAPSLADRPADPGADGPAHRRVRGTRQRLLRPGRQPGGPARGRRPRRAGAGLRRDRRAAVRRRCPTASALRDLGPHRLKDLGRPEQVFQLEAEFLPSGFPPLALAGQPRAAQQPARPARARSSAASRSWPRCARWSGRSRLVTLTGAGGCGKTRLALQAAAELLDGTGGRRVVRRARPGDRRRPDPGGRRGRPRAAGPGRAAAAADRSPMRCASRTRSSCSTTAST